ncbi:uncharacterized protein F4822DRAFT_411410 [Hypoxylon trugodes]|uniref:uncharacterized protein n=1 Tax=Hypoxylon trugodes TaxID=326681 RepID=UPI00218EDA36|nr:uncharacterized protein F4822DRAFT_411410 [Hypoxylon trugodes]KAI1386850.1 hypothetical protein F4822DRAFT_411410 [Hypoxylon trugodes]
MTRSNPFRDVDIVVDGDRPWVDKNDEPKFRTGDEVYISASGTEPRKGPYTIENVDTSSTPATYTLSDTNGIAENGDSFEESKLESK